MESITLKKIGNFVDRHLFLSTFSLLVILGTLLAFYITYTRTAHFYTMGGGIERIVFSAGLSILGIWLCMLLVFPISVILYSFLKKKPSHNSHLSFSRKFILSSIPAVSVILLILWTAQETPRDYTKEALYVYPIAIFISCVYSVMFGAFFGWQSKAKKMGIILQSVAVNTLMVVYYAVIYFLSHFSI